MIENFVTFFSDHIIISLVWVFLFIAVIYVTVMCWFANYFEISSYKVVQLINKEGSVVVDVRSECDFFRGCIINSINLSADDIRVSRGSELLKFQKKSLIIVCNDGVVSCSIARYLHKLDFKKIYVLKGGIISWKSSDLPLVIKKNR